MNDVKCIFFLIFLNERIKVETGLRENQNFNYLFVPALIFSAQLCK